MLEEMVKFVSRREVYKAEHITDGLSYVVVEPVPMLYDVSELLNYDSDGYDDGPT